MDTKRKKILLFGGIALSIVLIGSIFTINYLISNTLDNLNFKITAEKSEHGEILTDTNFIIKSEKNYSGRLMKKIVSVKPEIDYTFSKTSSGTYLITPNEKLSDSSIYNIYINVNEDKPALSWAFQTKAEFKVTGTLPSPSFTHIETDSGIEISFSKPVGDISEFFEIMPKVEGRFESLDKKAIFIPNELLKEDTVYKITLKKGLKSYLGDELEEDYTFSFRTKSDKPYISLLNGYQETQKPDNIQKIDLLLDDAYDEAIFSVNVYKLNSVIEYANYLETHYKSVDSKVGESYDHNFDMSKHSNVLSFSTYLTKLNSWYDKLVLPEKLSIGWYIVDITNSLNDIHLQKALQISDISVYTYGLNGDVQIWLNDSSTGNEIVGATVQLGDLAAISNKDGIASFNIAKDDMQKLIITSKDKKEFAEYLKVTDIETPNLEDDYYMYVYTDRKQYLPTDTINYWGVIIPRKSSIKVPKEVEIEIANDIKQVTKVDEKGAFSGSIDIVSHDTTWCAVMLNVLDRGSYMGEISISDYTKPVYKLSSSFNKNYYKSGDTMELLVYGKFYDGTLAENVKVKITENNGEYKTVTLNANGEAKTTLTPRIDSKDGGISYIYTTLEIAGIDESAYSYNNTLYFPTDYYINDSWNSADKKLTLSTNEINYDAINGTNIDYSKIYTGESFEQNIYAELIEVINERRYTGETEYDYYSGTFVPQYTYDRIENVIDTYNLTIPKGEKLVLDLPLVGENKEASYQVRLSYTYPDGFYGVKDIYTWAGNDYFDRNYYFSTDNNSLKENETARLNLNGKNVNQGRMLYVVSTDRINKIGVTNNDFLDVKMTKELIPNCIVTGAFFDGNTVYEISTMYIVFNTEDKELLIDITTDKESYRPGDTVKAKARVTDVNGVPVQCEFLFSVVDEAALFDSYEQSILSKLYEERYHFPITFTSDTFKEFGGEGGGGGDEIRDTFTDVLAFTPLYTNENGEANIEFKLSDDLTSWRITAVAVSDDVKAGKTKKNITTSIPFFINQVLNKKYVVNDDVTFSLRVSGSTVQLLSSFIKYDVELLNSNDEVIKTESKEVKPFDTVMINLGKLDAGKYKVKVTAVGGDNKDTILKEFEVIESLHEISLTKEFDVDKIKSLDAVKYPVHLMLFDKNNGLYYKSLKKILEKSNGGTNEQVLAKNYAYRKLNEFYGKDLYDTEFTTSLQNYGGGVNKLLNGDTDTLFTAQVLANANEYINALATEEYFNWKLEDENSLPSDVTAAYMGLAVLKKPVLSDIKYLLDNDNSFEVLDKINLINALTYIGDYETAVKYYEQEIQPIMTEKDGKKFISPEYETLYYQATSRILPTLALTNHIDFEKVLEYVLENDTKEYIPVMDLMTFINNYNPTTKCKSKIIYSINGEKAKIDFSKEKIKVLDLNKDEFTGFNVENVKGDVKVIAEYIGNALDIKPESDNIKITKTISKGEIGEYSTVTLNIVLPEDKEDYYILDDVIPSSSRYVSVGDITSGSTLEKQEGQRVKFYINAKKNNNITINYKIRNIFSGEFTVEPPYLTNKSGKVFGLSNSNLLTFNIK